jgi:hypothetical protein
MLWAAEGVAADVVAALTSTKAALTAALDVLDLPRHHQNGTGIDAPDATV